MRAKEGRKKNLCPIIKSLFFSLLPFVQEDFEISYSSQLYILVSFLSTCNISFVSFQDFPLLALCEWNPAAFSGFG